MLATTTWNDVAMVLTISTFVMVWVLVMITVGVKLRRQSQVAPATPKPANQPAAAHWAEDSLTVISRITQRFCPRCRAPLAADAPEGLCPACLMAGGLASAAAVEPASGFAVTTPPSGSKTPTQGEWSNLAERFPQLELLELLGRGGMGAVYKARQKNLDRIVALKVIPPEAAKDPTFAERFQREARAMARLNHANIVTVYDFGQVGEVYYLLMEYVDGVNLRHALRAARLAPTEALAIVPQICDALQYAHDQGVVHRDIKPENILLDRLGRVKIADFGLAKMLSQSPDNFTLTGTQQVMGTPRYMAPEQIERPSAVDHRADIYSLGVVFYEMLTGELPLGRFEPPSQKVQVDVRIDNVVLRTLEKEPERRYQRASHVKTELSSQAPPTWHTPMPSAKLSDGASPVGAPVGSAVAIATVMGIAGMICVAFALGSAAYANINLPWFSGLWWSWMFGGGVGGLLGGLGLLVGAYNVYRYTPGAFGDFTPARPLLEQMSAAVTATGQCLRHLSRSKDDCWISGVCGGLGEQTPFPAWCWRLLFIVLIFGYGIGLIAYVMMAICLPVGKEKPASPPSLGPATDWLRQLSRVNDDAWIGGVCGGLGRHTPIPSWCWRVLFLGLISVGVGFVPYVLLWICLPGPRESSDEGAKKQSSGEASPADDRPSWHTPAPATKSVAPEPRAKFGVAMFIAAGVLIFAVIGMAACFALYFTRSTIQPYAVTAELEEKASASSSKKRSSSSDFDRLLKSLHDESTDERKLSFIKLVSRSNHFTTEQARELLKAFDFDNNLVQAAVSLYPRGTDRKNFYLSLAEVDLVCYSRAVCQWLQ